MQLEKRVVGDVAIVKVVGELTLSKGNDALLHDNVTTLLREGHQKVLVDLTAVSYVDSAGLGQLVQAHSTAKSQGGSCRLFNPTARLRDLLALTNLTAVLGIYDSEEKAIASFGAGAK